MNSKYKHGGGYKDVALQYGLDWNQLIDYSISINWKAMEYFPNNLIFIPYEITDYPNPEYPELREMIGRTYNLSQKDFYLCNGANEAISILFQLFKSLNYHKQKSIVLVGSTYSEYNKYSDIHEFNIIKIPVENIDKFSLISDKIFILVNPNTPIGIYYDLKDKLEYILQSGAVVVVDESFIDFTMRQSLSYFIEKYPNLFIIKSLTKFYCSPGARLGLLINKSKEYENIINLLIPYWTISAYTIWFYMLMIPHYRKIKSATILWIEELSNKINSITAQTVNIKLLKGSETCYFTLELNEDFVKNQKIKDIKGYFLKNYNICVRPASDFYECSTNSFRVGLRLPNENVLLYRAIEDIG
jgi:threonine-phosphate decarboxylase